MGYGNHFSVQAVFGEPCHCCEYRQYFTCGSRARFWLRGNVSPWEVDQEYAELEEDCPEDAGGRCYGHRGDPPQPGDKYNADGCIYTAQDMPGRYPLDVYYRQPNIDKNLAIEYELKCRFVLSIIDTCCGSGQVVDNRILDFECSTLITLDDINDVLKKFGRPTIRK